MTDKCEGPLTEGLSDHTEDGCGESVRSMSQYKTSHFLF